MNKPVIRLVKKEDIEQLVALCKEHCSYEKASYDSSGKNDLLLKHLFPINDRIKCLIIEQDSKLLGYSTILKQFSTWDANCYYYMDCLYLKKEARRKGLGKLMMQEIKKLANKENCNLQWQTPEFNKNAIEFYSSLGATRKRKERFFWNIV